MDCSKRNILYDSECCTYILNDNDQKELRSMLPNFQLKIFHKWMKFKLSPQQYQNEIIIPILTMVHLAKPDIL